MRNVDWLLSVLASMVDRPPAQAEQEAFRRRERELQRRLANLEREVDVIQRTQTREEPRP